MVLRYVCGSVGFGAGGQVLDRDGSLWSVAEHEGG